jgi:hypothetical protein
LDLIPIDHVSEKEQDVATEYDVVDGQEVGIVAEGVLEYGVLELLTHSDFQPRFVYSELEDYSPDFPHRFHYLRSTPHWVVLMITICTVSQEHLSPLQYEH